MSDDPCIPAEHDSPCVHCGLCLDTCPTYRLTGVEAESPRGRLYLMSAVTEGGMPIDRDTIEHLDSCLGCLACESACPSGVHYGRRIEEFRPQIVRSRLGARRRVRALLARAGANARLLRVASGVASAFDRIGFERLRRHIPGLSLIPRHTSSPIRPVVPRPATPRLRVALLVGCVADQMRPAITSSAMNVLHRNGVEVILLPSGMCCGALDRHAGRSEAAARAVAVMCSAVEKARVDHLVTTAAGCGAAVRRFEELFSQSNPVRGIAQHVGRSSRDICELLVEIGLRPPQPRIPSERAVAYHDACHLLHGCGLARAPREILGAAGIRWVDLGENAICCGSAGVYNLLHPHLASALARRKADLLIEKGVSDVAIGNIGCIMQFELALARSGRTDVMVWHPIELLDAAYASEAQGRF
ncbi:MAG TPA: heterodisulfide reductase-related iron-sulfur binding cluster [Candidatus Binatia bacterium]|nr:heterodisulfide reductase-related iron-sulfur binding cluster [Candidatus Binatia bacterium]